MSADDSDVTVRPTCPRLGLGDGTEVAGYRVEKGPGSGLADSAWHFGVSCHQPTATEPPPIDGADYDVGPNCPRDELQMRLDAARALQRLNPPPLGPVRRWSI